MKRACGGMAAETIGESGVLPFDGGGVKTVEKPPLLLHSCCGPCSTAVVERLSPSYRLTVFFYNPNIYGEDEYDRRREAQLDFIRQYNGDRNAADRILFMEGPRDFDVFEAAARGLADAPEGGARCELCFRLRLEKTAETAVLNGFDAFATTLSVSPHKDYDAITRIGGELGLRYRIRYLAEDFKKQGGFQRSAELSKQYRLYRQNRCGCRFAGL
jgi:predicted adenine nucleotide alpha hydrolase (AANH) superfamily ATPase